MVYENNSKNFIFERVFIETPVDTDGDGKLDLIAAYIRRPASTVGFDGEKVPAVYVANPYMMTCNEDWYVPHDVNKEIKAFPSQNISAADIAFDFDAPYACDVKDVRVTSGFAETAIIDEKIDLECISELYMHLNDLGYATVFVGGLGTLGSEGFTLTGSREEILAFKAVIDWLNGRCRAFTNKTDNIEIKASWCTGKVAMSAKSYLGTMCFGVAATGVPGLETIIPEAGISNWYDYYRSNGLNHPALGWQGDDLDILAKYCFSRAKDEADYAAVKDAYDAALEELVKGEDRESGNYNKFWAERNYLSQASKIKASVFIIHGINDWNVKTNQCIPMFKALEELGVERKIMLHQGEHIYVYKLKESGTLKIIERWLDHYLRGVDNGIENEPKVLVESNIDQTKWLASDTFPPVGWKYEKFEINSGCDCNCAETVTIVDDLAATVYDREKDNLKEWLDELVLSEADSYKNRVKFVWNPCCCESAEVRVSGTVKVAFDAAINRETAILSAMLVDLGEACRITAEEVPANGEPEGTFMFGLEKEPSKYKVITRDSMNAQNRTSLYSKESIEPGKFYHYELDLVPTDHTLPAGHKLGLILYGIDAEETQRPDTVTEITVKVDSIDVQVPLCR